MRETGYLTGRELSKIREHVFRRLAMLFIEGGLKSIREEKPGARKGNNYIPPKSAFIEALGPERSLILSIISLTIADLGAGDRVEIGSTGKQLRKSAYEALWGEDRPYMELLCDMIDLDIYEVHKLAFAMQRYMSDRIIHPKDEDSDIIRFEQTSLHLTSEEGHEYGHRQSIT